MEKVLLLTGASSGIGLETAKLFQSKNWKVAATMRSPENAKDLARITDIKCLRLDVTDPESIAAAIESTLSSFGRIDAVFNNAGYGLLGPFEAASAEQIERQIRTNILGVLNVCREIIPYFREQQRGTIVNMASLGGRVVFPYSSLYNATKWAVEGFSESLQYELEPFNIKIRIIEPGPIKTDFYGRSQETSESDARHYYEPQLSRFLAFMKRSGNEAPDGSVVAKTVWNAVTDDSKKLRYPVNTKGLLFLRRVLPAGAFRTVTKSIFLR